MFSDAAGKVTVVLVDGQELIRRAVGAALRAAGIDVVGEAATAESGVAAVIDTRPDVVVMDVALHGRSAISAIEQISLIAPTSRILILTDSRDCDCVFDAIAAGAGGYIVKDADAGSVVEAVRVSAAGECVISSAVAGALLARIRERNLRSAAPNEDAADAIRSALTSRELDIFGRLATGLSNQEIAELLSLSEHTVKNHVASILAKLHLENRVQAAVQAVRSGLSCVASLVVLQAVGDATELPTAVVTLLFGG